MIRTTSLAVLVSGLAACASAPTPQQQILGKWTCESASEGMAAKGAFEYLADGTIKAEGVLDSEQGGMPASVTADIAGTWRFLEDGRLEETITSMKVKSATMSGMAAPKNIIDSMIQPMVNQMVVGQATVSTPEFAGNSYTSTDEDGVVTTCRR